MTATRHLLDFTGTPRLFVDVEPGDAGTVDLVIELPPTELLPSWVPDRPILDPGIVGYSALWSYAEELEALLKRVREAGQIERNFTPAEARAIAASLVHYAAEVEAGRA